jgi:hypothetical protein
MEEAGREIAYPTVEQIREVNRRKVEEFGGFFAPPDNLLLSRLSLTHFAGLPCPS